MNENQVDQIAIPILKEILTEAQDQWRDINSKYREYRNLQIDKRGSFGERFFSKALIEIYFRRLNIEYKDGDQGDWDLKFNGFKFEIKTASIDVNEKFQNEGVNIDGDYYGILFLGVTPNQLYIKFVLKSDIPFNQLHNRGDRGTGRGYKWDFKVGDMILVSDLQEIKNEFEKHFLSVLNTKV